MQLLIIENTSTAWPPVLFSRNSKKWKPALKCRGCKRRDGPVVVPALSVWNVGSRKCTFRLERVNEKKLVVTRVSHLYPMLALHFVGLRVWNDWSINRNSWNIFWRKRSTVLILGYWYKNTCFLRALLSVLDVLSNNTKLVNCNGRHSLSQYNEFSNGFSREFKIQLPFQWSLSHLWVRTEFSSVLPWSQINHLYMKIFEIINRNWGDIILKVLCFICGYK